MVADRAMRPMEVMAITGATATMVATARVATARITAAPSELIRALCPTERDTSEAGNRTSTTIANPQSRGGRVLAFILDSDFLS